MKLKVPISTALLREQLTRFWPLALLALLYYLFVVVLPIGHFVPREQWTSRMFAAGAMMDLLAMRNTNMINATIVVPLITAMCLFSYAFSHKATLAFHSFPINKSQLFVTNMIAGLILMIVPLLLLSFVLLLSPLVVEPGYLNQHGIWVSWSIRHRATLFPTGLSHGDVINSFSVVAGFFGRAVVAYVFYFILFTLAISVSGNLIVALLMSAVIPFVPMGFYLVGRAFVESYVFGIVPTVRPFRGYDTILFYTNPTSWQHFFHHEVSVGSDNFFDLARPLHPYLISYILIGAAMLATAYICFQKRRHERAGDSIVFLPLKKVLIFLVSMGGMFICGVFIMYITQSGRTGLYLGYVIGFVISFFIAQMIAETSLQVWRKVKLLPVYGGVTLGIYLLIIGITHVGMLPVINYVPQRENIAGVLFSDSSTWLFVDDTPTDFFRSDPEIIDVIVELHERILDDRQNVNHVWQQYAKGPFVAISRPFPHNASYLYLAYRMNDGRTISRVYLIPAEWANDFWEGRWGLRAQVIVHPWWDTSGLSN